MSKYSRFARFFSTGAAGLGLSGVLASAATLTTPTASNNPLDTHVTVQDTGHPHVTTRKEFVPDPMEKKPKVIKTARSWPRLPSDYFTDSSQTISAQEASARQAQHSRELAQKKTLQAEIEENEEEAFELTQTQVSRFIDHTQLKAFASKKDIESLCNEAMAYNFKSVCVNPVYVKYCSNLLQNSGVKVCSVVGFPLGANSTEIKVLEALQAVHDGAQEIDMVISIGAVKSQAWDAVEADIASVVEAVSFAAEEEENVVDNVVVKVILETSMLTKEEIVKCCQICVQAGANYVKTSTGFGGGGASVETVKLMKETVGKELKKMGRKESEVKVKASGGVRNFEKAKDMIKAGASRIGTSSGVHIIGKDKSHNNKKSMY